MLIFPGANVEVFQYCMKGCIGRLTCLPLIYCLLSWNGRIVGVRTTITQQSVFFFFRNKIYNIKALFSCVNMQLSNKQVKYMFFGRYYKGLSMKRCVKPSHFKGKLISSEDKAYNNDDCCLLLSCWALTWDARADSGSTLVLTSNEFLFDGSTWVLQSIDLKWKKKLKGQMLKWCRLKLTIIIWYLLEMYAHMVSPLHLQTSFKVLGLT